MNPISRLEQVLSEWDGEHSCIQKDDRAELITKIALNSIGDHSTPKELKNLLSKIETPELQSKIELLNTALSNLGNSDFEHAAKLLGLDEWKSEGNTEEAKRRILENLARKEPFLDLSDLKLTDLPECLAVFSHVQEFYCDKNNLKKLTLPPKIELLECSYNPELEKIPSKQVHHLEELISVGNPNLRALPKLPKLSFARTDDHLFRQLPQRMLETFLGLDHWYGGPDTQEIKNRIVDCYRESLPELDLSGLEVMYELPDLSKLTHHPLIFY